MVAERPLCLLPDGRELRLAVFGIPDAKMRGLTEGYAGLDLKAEAAAG